MIKSLLLIVSLVVVSCASRKHSSIFDLADKTKYSVIKKTEVASMDEANKVLQNRFNFLTLLFEQSRDPYYGHPKWSESCLKSNKIGVVTKNKNELTSVSELYVDNSGSPGFCPENPFAIKAYEVSFYCEKEHLVYQVTLPSNQHIDLEEVSLCR